MKWILEEIEAAEIGCKGCMSSWPPRLSRRVLPLLEALLAEESHCQLKCGAERNEMVRGKGWQK